MRNTPGPYGLLQGNRVIKYSFAALLAAGVLFYAGSAQAQDGKALMQKVAKAYKDLASYEGSATVDISIMGSTGAYKDKPLQKPQSLVALLKFKRPNKLMLDMTAPTGSRRVYCDGKDFYVYDVSNNQYIRDSAPADSKGLLLTLLQRAGIQTALDPLYFLTDGTLPPELSQLKVTGSKKLNGRDTFVLTGVTRSKRKEVKQANGQKTVYPATTRNWTWWVDKQNFLLRRIEVNTPDLKAGQPVQQGKKVVVKPIPAYHFSRYTAVEVKPNSTPDDKLFVFNKPKNASEKKSLQDLLKGAQ